MIVTIKQLDAVYCKVISPMAQDLVWEILSYEEEVRNIFTGYPEKATKSFLDRRGMKFLSGLLPFVEQELKKRGHTINLYEIKYKKLKRKLVTKVGGITFEPYQKRCFGVLGINSRGIIVGPTGMGKSYIGLGAFTKLNYPVTIFIVPTKSILKQIVKDFTTYFPDLPIGIVGDDECSVGHVTVALFQSLSKWDLSKLNNIVELVIVDECHRMNDSILLILRQLTKCFYRYGLTATTPDQEEEFKKHAKMIGALGPVLCEVSDEECLARVTPCEVYLLHYYCHNPKGSSYHEIYSKDILFSRVRNRKILLTIKKLVLSKGKTCVILLDQIEQAKAIQEMAIVLGLSPEIVHSKTEKGHNEKIKEILNKRKANLVIATGVWGIGTSINNIDCIVLASARKSYADVFQKIGRGRRRTAEKEVTMVIDIADKVRNNSMNKSKKCYKYFEKYSNIRLGWYKKKGWKITEVR